MPLYEYNCPKCDHTEDFIKPMEERHESEVCSKCGADMIHNSVAGLPLFRLGQGFWYRNDYTYGSQKELDVALKENDMHQKAWDKKQKNEEGMG